MLFATPRGSRGFVHAGHFGYGHIDPVVLTGEIVAPGDPIGWTCRDDWHVHLSEFIFTTSGNISVNPLRPGGKLQPYVDTAPPVIHAIRFHRPASARWGRRATTSVARMLSSGRRLPKDVLSGRVDVRAQVSDPQSFDGWFADLPHLAAPHHPFRLAVTIVHVATGRMVRRREAFRAEQVLDQPAGKHFAPGTEQNLPAGGCMRRQAELRCQGVYWFRLFPRGWDTSRHPDGRYVVRVRAWDVAGNLARAEVEVRIANGV